MSVWAVLAVAGFALLTLSVVVGLSVGAILGHISRQVTELQDLDGWTGMSSSFMTLADCEALDVRSRQQQDAGRRPRVTNRS